MITTEKLTLAFGDKPLFENVDVKFTPGNCYGLIGANGAGKSTLLRCLAGEEDRASGQVIIPKGLRMSWLRQDHFAFNDVPVLQCVIMGHKQLHEITRAKDAIYAKPDFSDEDGMEVAELESQFADLDGWNAEANAAVLLSNLGIGEGLHNKLVSDIEDNEKVRVLLAQALFGEPDILLLDEPTNHLNVDSILWLEDFLMRFKNTVIVVSHDRHFLDKVCTHIADVDFRKVTMFAGNYTFWYKISQLALRQRQEANRKKEDKMSELKSFIQRFSANASKSKQASSRKSLLDKISLDDIRPSSRKYPYIVFNHENPLGKQVLNVQDLCRNNADGDVLFKNLSFTLGKGERIALTGNEVAVSTLLDILAGEDKADSGTIEWGSKCVTGYFPKDNQQFFSSNLNLIDWMKQFTDNEEETFVRSFLGRMLFSGAETQKPCYVLSGGEKVRCMVARMMLQDPNVLLLDGPTDHLDLESITALNNGLEKFEGSMILNSHDVQFVDTLVSRVIELDGEEHFDVGGDYEAYLRNDERKQRFALRAAKEREAKQAKKAMKARARAEAKAAKEAAKEAVKKNAEA